MVSHFVKKNQSIMRRSGYVLLSLLTTITITLTSLQSTEALNWGDVIFRGIQVFQLSNMSDRQEIALGKEINNQLLSNGEVKLYRDRGANQYIDQIGQKLVAQSIRPRLPYTFQVVESDEINAFATMGGFVYVNTGLLKTADNEAQLASVMAHEIGHIAARHALKQMRESVIAEGITSAAGLDRNKAVQIGIEFALRRPHSRAAEYQADQLGIMTLGKAGYDQSAAITFMEKLAQKSSPPTFLNTHPAPKSRMQAMSKMVDPSLNQGKGLDDDSYRDLVRKLF